MNKDISSLLSDWDYDPSSISARRITGTDGRPKVQLRLDLGLFQMEIDGRPDGERPRGYPSLLDYYNSMEKTSTPNVQALRFDESVCSTLQQEAIQYYYRYISLFALQDYERVVRDTSHNIDLIMLVSRRTRDEDLAWQFLQFYPDVRSMKARALAEQHISREEFDEAIKAIRHGLKDIRSFWKEYGEEGEESVPSPEEDALVELLDEVRTKKPRTQAEVLREELERAISIENYEKAAQLRDRLKKIKQA